MTTTPNMSLVLPTEDASDDLWDTLLNAALTLIDLHDHSTGAGVPVPTAGLGIDADLPFAGFAATGLKAIHFNAVTAIASGYLRSLFANTADDELTWRNAAGVNVQITDGNGLNASLLGGITGDYGSGDEEVNYSAGSSIYNFLVDDSPARRAYIDCSDIRLFEATNGITNAVKLKSPAALAASYTITFPGAAPAGLRILQMNSSGVVSASNTVTAALTVDAPLTVSVNNNVTISGTGVYKHGTKTRVISCLLGSPQSNSIVFSVNAGAVRLSTSGDTWYVPITMNDGEQLLAVRARVKDNVTGTTTVTLTVRRSDDASTANIGSAATSAGSGAWQTLAVTGLTEVISHNTYTRSYYAFLAPGASNLVELLAIYVDYDQP